MSDLRLFVCVDSSPGALAAARLALTLAQEHGGRLRAVSVIEDGHTARKLDVGRRRGEPAAERLARSARIMLERIAALAAERGIPIETHTRAGDALGELLKDAREWQPDFILIGRAGRAGPGSPLLGSLAMHVIEFADQPVIVVPPGENPSVRIA